MSELLNAPMTIKDCLFFLIGMGIGYFILLQIYINGYLIARVIHWAKQRVKNGGLGCLKKGKRSN